VGIASAAGIVLDNFNDMNINVVSRRVTIPWEYGSPKRAAQAATLVVNVDSYAGHGPNFISLNDR
jgi:hypothetical protein